MNNNFIGVFDSGVGGLNILEKLKELLPNESFLYYADKNNFPYGNKDTDELLNITFRITEEFIKRNCKLIVIACNTATTKCLKKLEEKYSETLFVGITPAIKKACNSNYKNILVMATPATIGSKKTKQLVQDYKKEDQNVYLEAFPTLATSIEKENSKEILEILNNTYLKYKDKNIDAIVLGCTHYSFIRKQLQSLFTNVTIIDAIDDLAYEVKSKLEENNLLSNNSKREVLFLDKLS